MSEIHDELMDRIYWHWRYVQGQDGLQALVDYRRVIISIMLLHKPKDSRGDLVCSCCGTYNYPCPTIQAIQTELGG